jgi:hypothetical protein
MIAQKASPNITIRNSQSGSGKNTNPFPEQDTSVLHRIDRILSVFRAHATLI